MLEVIIPNDLFEHACFFTPKHELIILGGLVNEMPSTLIATITEENGVVSEEPVDC